MRVLLVAVRVATVAQLLEVAVARLAIASTFTVDRVALYLVPVRDWRSEIQYRW